MSVDVNDTDCIHYINEFQVEMCQFNSQGYNDLLVKFLKIMLNAGSIVTFCTCSRRSHNLTNCR